MVATESRSTMNEKPEAPAMMRAIVCDRYGPVEGVQLREIASPVVDADRVVLKVQAASINPVDIHNVKGGLVIRATSGLRRPKQPVPGVDVAGIVIATGENVTHLHPGDEVFGTCPGTLAEYARGGKNLIPKPASISFEQGAAVGVAGITALQGLRDSGKLQPGQTVLINGAAGGVGAFAVQIARALGADVTGVCSTRNVDLVRSLGAQVIDYTREDFARSGRQYDLVFDLVGNRSLSDLRRAVKPEGTLVLCGGGHDRGHGRSVVRPLLTLARGLLLSRFVSQRIVSFMAKINRADLLSLSELIEAGKVAPVVDRTYPLSKTAEAMRYLETGHARAKVVITV